MSRRVRSVWHTVCVMGSKIQRREATTEQHGSLENILKNQATFQLRNNRYDDEKKPRCQSRVYDPSNLHTEHWGVA